MFLNDLINSVAGAKIGLYILMADVAGLLVLGWILCEVLDFLPHLVSMGDGESTLALGQHDGFVEVLIVWSEENGDLINSGFEDVV